MSDAVPLELTVTVAHTEGNAVTQELTVAVSGADGESPEVSVAADAEPVNDTVAVRLAVAESDCELEGLSEEPGDGDCTDEELAQGDPEDDFEWRGEWDGDKLLLGDADEDFVTDGDTDKVVLVETLKLVDADVVPETDEEVPRLGDTVPVLVPSVVREEKGEPDALTEAVPDTVSDTVVLKHVDTEGVLDVQGEGELETHVEELYVAVLDIEMDEDVEREMVEDGEGDSDGDSDCEAVVDGVAEKLVLMLDVRDVEPLPQTDTDFDAHTVVVGELLWSTLRVDDCEEVVVPHADRERNGEALADGHAEGLVVDEPRRDAEGVPVGDRDGDSDAESLADSCDDTVTVNELHDDALVDDDSEGEGETLCAALVEPLGVSDTEEQAEYDKERVALVERRGEALSVTLVLVLPDVVRDTDGDLLPLTDDDDERVTERVIDADTDPLGTGEEVGEVLFRVDDVSPSDPELHAEGRELRDADLDAELQDDALGDAETEAEEDALRLAVWDTCAECEAEGHDESDEATLALAERLGDALEVEHMLGLPDELRDVEGDLLLLTEAVKERSLEADATPDCEPLSVMPAVGVTLPRTVEVGLGN